MAEIKPTCPYCGEAMGIAGCDDYYWFVCHKCDAASPPAYDRAEALAKASHRASVWYSVKDGMPDSGTICVVHGHNKRGVDCYDIALKEKIGWEFGSMSAFEIRHWMPLPEAPKEE